jgi:GNAT superfamily N-acetyltransferase
MSFLSYQPEHRSRCLSIFDSNVPDYFDETERPEFAAFLAAPDGPYLVLQVDDQIVACGGVAQAEDRAHLCWGMVHKDWHGKGLGRALLEERVKLAASLPGVAAIVCATSQHTEAFYFKKGFTRKSIVPHGWAPGLHRIEMVKSI